MHTQPCRSGALTAMLVTAAAPANLAAELAHTSPGEECITILLLECRSIPPQSFMAASSVWGVCSTLLLQKTYDLGGGGGWSLITASAQCAYAMTPTANGLTACRMRSHAASAASGLGSLRHCGATPEPTPTGDYPPRASHLPGGQRMTSPALPPGQSTGLVALYAM
jgi:hypothetical protein